jgi:hypothetical protein
LKKKGNLNMIRMKIYNVGIRYIIMNHFFFEAFFPSYVYGGAKTIGIIECEKNSKLIFK